MRPATTLPVLSASVWRKGSVRRKSSPRREGPPRRNVFFSLICKTSISAGIRPARIIGAIQMCRKTPPDGSSTEKGRARPTAANRMQQDPAHRAHIAPPAPQWFCKPAASAANGRIFASVRQTALQLCRKQKRLQGRFPTPLIRHSGQTSAKAVRLSFCPPPEPHCYYNTSVALCHHLKFFFCKNLWAIRWVILQKPLYTEAFVC